MNDNVTMTAIDGTDALAFVIIRPGSTEGGLSIEAAANGLSQPGAAYVLRHVANQWDGGNGDQSATLTALNLLAERWQQMADHGDVAIGSFDGPAAANLDAEVAERGRTYRKAVADLREVLVTGRIPRDLMTDSELSD
ncbi:hypothetical protein [Streptomyces sp. AM6-12]|uniref:hypothetical protein n=1 Tax=Streptomyces sp. AM6-12 TaxID=3345149 RepID=UPI0037BE16C6